MKRSASKTKPFQSRSKGEIPGRARWKERLSRSKLKQAFLIDSDAEFFMYLIQCIRFGSWKVRRLNRALINGNQFTSKRHATNYLSCMTKLTTFLKLAKNNWSKKENKTRKHTCSPI